VTEEEFRHVLSTFPLIPSEQREAAMQRYGARSRWSRIWHRHVRNVRSAFNPRSWTSS